MNQWIGTVAVVCGITLAKKQAALRRGMVACATMVPLLMAGCTPIETEFRLAKNQKEVALSLDARLNHFKLFGLENPIALVLSAPKGVVFADKTSNYRLDLDVGQKRHYVFDLFHPDGTLDRKVEFKVEGYDRSSDKEQPFEKRIYSKAPNNRAYTPRWLSTQYRYTMGGAQQEMALNIGNFRQDPKSEFIVQGKMTQSLLIFRAPAGEQFVFSKELAKLEQGDRTPTDATKAQDYRIRMVPGQAQSFQLWLSNENNRVRPHTVSVQYSSTL